MDKLKLSIIIPVYNNEKFLENCLFSIQQQQLQEMEVLMIDDGSTDTSPKICQQFEHRDARFVYVRKENGGVSSARNLGLNKARGTYVTFIDSDDYIQADYLAHLVTQMDLGFGMVVCGYDVIQDGKVEETRIFKENTAVSKNELYHLMLRNQSVFSVPWNKIFVTSIIKEHQLYFDESIAYGEDLVFDFEYAAHTKQAFIMKYNGYKYVQHASSASGGKIDPQKLAIRMTDIDAMKKVLDILTVENQSEIDYLTKRIAIEGSRYYRLAKSYQFSEPVLAAFREKIAPYVKNYLKQKDQVKLKGKLVLNFHLYKVVNLVNQIRG